MGIAQHDMFLPCVKRKPLGGWAARRRGGGAKSPSRTEASLIASSEKYTRWRAHEVSQKENDCFLWYHVVSVRGPHMVDREYLGAVK